MPKVAKKSIQQMAKMAKQTGEAVVKESKKILETAAQQTGLPSGSKDSGIEQVKGGGIDPQQVAKKKKEDQEKVAFFRRQIQDFKREQQKIQSDKMQQKQQEEQEEQEKIRIIKEKEGRGQMISAPAGKSGRGTALMGKKKKTKGAGEMGAFAKRSK